MIGKKQAFAKAVLVLIIIFSLGTVAGLTGYALSLKKAFQGSAQQEKSVKKPAIEPEAISDDEKEEWKIYKNEEYGFEFKYPKNLSSEEKTDSVLKSFSVLLKSDDLNGYLLVNDPGIGTGFDIAVSTENVSIGGIDSKLEILDSSIDNQRTVKVSFAKNGNDYFWLLRFDKSDTTKLSLITDIFNSFRFAEKEALEDWKIYKNEKYGFEFQYPEDWFVKSEMETSISVANSRYKKTEGEHPFIFFWVYDNKKNLSLRNWFNENQKSFFADAKPVEGKDYKLEDLTVQNYKALRFSYSRMAKVTLIDFNSKVISASAINTTEGYDQILSTFKASNK